MGFVDIVGVSTGYIQKDFGLSDSLAQLIPSMVFIWFLVFFIAINKMPSRANEIFGLLIMAVVGGAVIPPIMGFEYRNNR